MVGQQEFVATALGYAEAGLAVASGRLVSPAAWTQFGFLAGAFLLAMFATRWRRPALVRLVEPVEASTGLLALPRRPASIFLPLHLPHLAYRFTAAGDGITRSIFEAAVAKLDFAVEFRGKGIDGGRNMFTSKARFAVWSALRENGIEIPYPHRVVELRGGGLPA